MPPQSNIEGVSNYPQEGSGEAIMAMRWLVVNAATQEVAIPMSTIPAYREAVGDQVVA